MGKHCMSRSSLCYLTLTYLKEGNPVGRTHGETSSHAFMTSLPLSPTVRICGSPAQLATNLRCMEPDMSSGCNAEVSPQGWAVESPAVIVRFLCRTKELITYLGKPETEPEQAINVGQSWRSKKCCLPVSSTSTDNLP